jgi:surfactin synthase thioesterase subunit
MTSVASSGGEWVRVFHRSAESDVRLVCFPHAGGSASYYFPMSKSLTPGIETLALQYPGRQDRRKEGCIDDISTLADRAFDALRSWDSRPLAFFGHSMGSILAFEVALRFQDTTDRCPVRLFASGYPAPSRLRGGSIHLRDDAGIAAELLSMGGTDTRWLEDADLMASVMPAIRADYKAIETHSGKSDSMLDCPITMLVGDSDPETTVAEASAWREHTTGEFDLCVFPGGHFYLDEHGPAVANMISTTLEGVLR